MVATASAFYFSSRQPKQYEAKASLIYERGLDLSNPLTGQGAVDANTLDREIASISDVMASPYMRARAAKALKGEAIGSPAEFTVSASPQETHASSTTQASNVVAVRSSPPFEYLLCETMRPIDPRACVQQNGAWRRRLPRPSRMEADHR